MLYPVSFADIVFAILLNGLVVLAAIRDVLSFRIPNAISAALVALYPAYVAFSPNPPDWPVALAIAAAVLAVGIVLFSAGVVGGGDAKLLAAVCLWAGREHALDLVLIMALAGGALSLAVVAAGQLPVDAMLRRIGAADLATALASRQLPYGVAIAAGTVLSIGAALWGGLV